MLGGIHFRIFFLLIDSTDIYILHVYKPQKIQFFVKSTSQNKTAENTNTNRAKLPLSKKSSW